MIDAIDGGNVSRFINHSCLPNLASVRVYSAIPDSRGIYPFPRMVFVAILNIKPGDQLTFYYGGDYFSLKNIPCYCYQHICYIPPSKLMFQISCGIFQKIIINIEKAVRILKIASKKLTNTSMTIMRIPKTLNEFLKS